MKTTVEMLEEIDNLYRELTGKGLTVEAERLFYECLAARRERRDPNLAPFNSDLPMFLRRQAN